MAVRNIGKTGRETVALRGINLSMQTENGDLIDCKNISTDKFPYITTAKTDTAVTGTGYEGIMSMAAYKKLYTFDTDGKMYADGADLSVTTSKEAKQTAMMANGTMMLLPDEKLINPTPTNLTGANVIYISDISKFYAVLDAKNISRNGTHTFAYSDSKWNYTSDPTNELNGTVADIAKWGLNFPNDSQSYGITIGNQTVGREYVLSVSTKCDNATNKTYLPKPNGIVIRTGTAESLTADEQKDNILIARGGDGDDVIDKVIKSNATSGMLTIDNFTPSANQWYSFRRCEVPDFVCSWANRFWCCNSEKQLIFASEQGKAHNFYTDMSLASGSYQVAIGDSEFFTGCCEYGNGVLFFKQNRIYKIVGKSPKNYQLYTYEVEGVKKGCHKSLCVIGNVLYYVGLHGVYAYAGGKPVLISQRLGNMEIENAVGGTDGRSYYLSFESGGKDYLFVYDTKYGIWLKKDNIKVADFARTEDNFYYLADNTVHKAGTGATRNDTEWHIQFTPFREKVAEKRYTRLLIRYELGNKSHMTVKTRYDGGVWSEEGKIIGGSGIQEVRLPVNRCDKFELRIEGKGEATILNIEREYETGSVIDGCY